MDRASCAEEVRPALLTAPRIGGGKAERSGDGMLRNSDAVNARSVQR